MDKEDTLEYGDRIKSFIDAVYKKQKFFSDKSEINGSQLSYYVTNRSKPTMETLQKFYDMGMSIDWLLSTKETGLSMFADNQTGLGLKLKFIMDNKLMNEQDLSNIKIQIPDNEVMRYYFGWIILNYNKIENFCKLVSLLPHEITYMFNNSMASMLESYLERAGCNTKFPYSDEEGSIWNNTEAGQLLAGKFIRFYLDKIRLFHQGKEALVEVINDALATFYNDKPKVG